MSHFLSNIFAVFSIIYQSQLIKIYVRALLLIKNNEESPFSGAPTQT